MKNVLICIILLLSALSSFSQTDSTTLTQRVRGYITDAESKQPLPGVIILLSSNKQVNSFSDSNGYYILENVPIGRRSFEFNYMGYDPRFVQDVMVSSGKELELNIALTESLHELKEVKITANKNRTQAQNEFATLSARSFSVEETRRYAASISDPARMVMNFAGVSGNGDLENDIVVRGNSPRGVLWRLEGIDIPNPNHFSSMGNSGGAVSMLNANTLATSDFYTGAFPPEIGNALSGAFDLSLRNGNKDNYEHTFQIGILGTEIATEGPFKKGGQSSYLIDYRYSTLTLILDQLNLNGLIPDYQDISFKLNFPTKKAGTFSVFGIGGTNKVLTDPPKDSTQWNTEPNFKLTRKSKMGTAGIGHQYFITTNSYIKTVVSGSYEYTYDHSDSLQAGNNYSATPIAQSIFKTPVLRLSSTYNNKLNTSNTIRTGIIIQQINYDYRVDLFFDALKDDWSKTEQTVSNTQFYQAFFQWKDRITDKLTVISGLHGSYFALNQKGSIEPRASVSYSINKSKYTVAAGFHSKPDHISTYLYRDSAYGINNYNQDLDLLRAFHTVLGYEVPLPFKSRLKAELYYQKLYNIPVEADMTSGFSTLNTENVYSLIGTKPLKSLGTGTNYGLDLTLERPLSDNYYILFTGSLFKSTYTNYKGDTYNGHYDRGYQANLIGGKEFYLNKKRTTIVGLNGKLLYSGGQRESPIDVSQSIYFARTIYVQGEYYSLRDPYYFRSDAGVYFKLNNKKATHSIEINVQNLTNRKNFSYFYFDTNSGKIKNVYETGLIPALSYRIEFHR